MNWFISEMKKQGILFLVSVDVKTENIVIDGMDSLLDYYDVSFTQNKKLGGTAPYIHGDTDVLKEALIGTPLENCDVTVANIGTQKRTFILDAPFLESEEQTSSLFYFAEKITPDGSRFYEVRTRHQSSQQEIYVKLSRKKLVISNTDELMIKKFIFDSFGPSEESNPA
jgi:hypothetical protein